MGVAVAWLSWVTTSWRPPWLRTSEVICMTSSPRAQRRRPASGAWRRSCCRPDRADRRGRATPGRCGCRDRPRSGCRRRRCRPRARHGPAPAVAAKPRVRAIAVGGGLAVDRLGDHEDAAVLQVHDAALGVDHHAADALARVHQVEALVDLVEREHVGDHRVDLDLAVHVPVDDLRHVGAALGAAERRAAPVAAGDQLERPGGDLLAGFGDADDDAGAPAAVAAFERGAHHLGVAGAVEAVVGAAVGQLDDLATTRSSRVLMPFG
jgi:hypothetical protein